jgi:transposase
MQIITIGLDLAKSVFQIHGVDATGQVAVRKSLRRSQMLPFFAKLPPPGRHRGVRHVASLGARADQARP